MGRGRAELGEQGVSISRKRLARPVRRNVIWGVSLRRLVVSNFAKTPPTRAGKWFAIASGTI